MFMYVLRKGKKEDTNLTRNGMCTCVRTICVLAVLGRKIKKPQTERTWLFTIELSQ